MEPTPTEPDLSSLPEWARVLIADLQRRVAELEARLAKDSSNSSKPPSSDPPFRQRGKKKARPGPDKRKRGGQPGHEPHNRAMLAPEKCDAIVDHRPAACPCCGEALVGCDAAPQRHQVTEIPPAKAVVTEHRLHRLACARCGARTRAELPRGVPATSFGPRLQAAAAMLVGAHRVPRRGVRELLATLFGANVSLGAISKMETRTAAAMEKPFDEIAEHARKAPAAHADETPWPDGPSGESTVEIAPGARLVEKSRKRLGWMWTLATKDATIFLIRETRSREAARVLLGEGGGRVLTTDRYAAYSHLPLDARQLCWAHLRRDFAALCTNPNTETARLGELLSMKTGELFAAWSRLENGAARSDFDASIAKLREEFSVLLAHGAALAEEKTARFCKGLEQVFPALWTFSRIDGVEPTNNRAERALRHAVCLRKTSFGTMSASGARFIERLLSLRETLRIAGTNLHDFLTQAIEAHTKGSDPPKVFATG